MARSKRLMLYLLCGLTLLAPVSLFVVWRSAEIDPDELKKFHSLRNDAQSITVGMSYQEVIGILGIPDTQSDWLEHLPNRRVYFFDTDRENALGRKPKAYIAVLIDSKSGVKTVDVYDPVFETCTGNKIDNTCTPINRKHHDRFAGPVIIGA